MLGAGTIINPIIKVVTTVAILAAVYFFIIAPILDTTEESFNAFDDAFPDVSGLSTDIQSQIDDALEGTGSSSGLEDCIRRAIGSGADADRIQRRTGRCVDRSGA
ncbi:MAG TPA: hypothetical protein VHF58_01775 [Solirubrobacterales bacterium]|nr:hypothetical protein [Solirubrobacterales bacterium]